LTCDASSFLLKICSSDLISDEWIASLYNPEITKLTPLDFRLIAASVFRLIAVQCDFFKTSVDFVRDTLSSERLVSSQALSEAAFDGQIKTIRDKFTVHIAGALLSSHYSELIILIMRLSGIASGLQTNTFLKSVPRSNKYEFLNNLYPINDNVTSIEVSYF
jgi:hypothetical protein